MEVEKEGGRVGGREALGGREEVEEKEEGRKEIEIDR